MVYQLLAMIMRQVFTQVFTWVFTEVVQSLFALPAPTVG